MLIDVGGYANLTSIFLFQAEDGIRYIDVTGVQTCALPILEEIRSLGTTVLRIEAFAEPFFAASIVAYSVCVGAGDTLRPALMNLFSMWCVRLTLAYKLSQTMGLKGVWIAMAIELTFRGTIFLVRLFRGKWMKSFGV